MVRIVCPHCNQQYDVDEEIIGAKVECTVCNTSFVAERTNTPETIKLQLNPVGNSARETQNTAGSVEPTSPSQQTRLDKKWIILMCTGCAIILFLLVTVIVLLAQRGTSGTVVYSSQPVGNLAPGTPSELLLKYTEMGETSYVAEILKQNPSFDIDRMRTSDNKTVLYIACEKGYEDIVKLFLKRKPDIGICDMSTTGGPFGGRNTKFNSLTIAARNGQLAVVKALLATGFDIESQDCANRTALYAAAENNQPEVVEFLCKSKAKVNCYGRNGFTPLTAAAIWSGPEVVQILLKYGADIEMRDQGGLGGKTPVYHAVDDNKQEVVEILCKAGADLTSYASITGHTPLTKAVDTGNIEIIKILLKYGADPYQKDNSAIHANAFQWAERNKRSDIVALLRTYQAK